MAIHRPRQALGLCTLLALTGLMTSPWPRSESAATAWTQPDDPIMDDDQAEELARSRRVVEENCLMCHGSELIASQRLTAAQWTAEVDKMMGWGAPVPPEERDRLIRHLADTYPSDRAAMVPERLSPMDLLASESAGPLEPTGGDAGRGASLYATHCASCHGASALGGELGTCLAGRSILTRRPAYDAVVLGGLRRMPAFGEVLKPQDQADLLEWLRTR